MLAQRPFSSKNISDPQPLCANSRPKDWSHTLWREWSNCEDEEYARHLFDLLIDEQAGWRAIVGLVLGGMIYGALGGLLTIALLYWGDLNAVRIGWVMGLGVALGAIGGLLVGLGLKLRRRLSWDAWFQGIIPTRLLIGQPQDNIFNLLYLMSVVGLSTGLGASLTGAFFFGQSELWFFYGLILGLFFGTITGFLGKLIAFQTHVLIAIIAGILFAPCLVCQLLILVWSLPGLLTNPLATSHGMLTGLLAGFLFEAFSARRLSLPSVLVSVVAGVCFSLFFGLGFAQFIGLLIGPLNVSNSARVVGLAVGIGAGTFLGRGAGLAGVLVWQVIIGAIVLATAPNLILLSWLLGLFLGGLLGSVSQMILPERRLEFAEVYKYRLGYFWWQTRPLAVEVESALQGRPLGNGWTELFNRLAKQRAQPAGTTILRMAALCSPLWIDRFIARHALVTLGDKALLHLLTILNAKSDPRQQVANWVTRSIGHETKTRLSEQAGCMLCADCLTCCGSHTEMYRFGLAVTYYGCRLCGQTREFFHCPQGVVAVLNAGWTNGHIHYDGLLCANWLTRRTLFDFDRVEIIQATDEDVERFAVQVGNDTDPLRRPRYLKMQCDIAPTCNLSENTLRILQRIFGCVEYRGASAC